MAKEIVLKKDATKKIKISFKKTSKQNIIANTGVEKRQKTQRKKLYNNDGDEQTDRAIKKAKINFSLQQRRLYSMANTVTINAYD